MFPAPIVDSVLISLCVLHVMHFEYIILIFTPPDDWEIHECFFIISDWCFLPKKCNYICLFARPFKEFWLCKQAWCLLSWHMVEIREFQQCNFNVSAYGLQCDRPAIWCSCYTHIDFRDTNTLSVFIGVLPSVVNNDWSQISADFYVLYWRIYKDYNI